VPLHDHFRPPLSERRHWHSFHSAWATFLASSLNAHLPRGYFAEPNVQFGIEIDVATFEEAGGEASATSDERTASLAQPWSAPQPTWTIPFAPTAEGVEVLIYSSEGGPVLAGAVELISPANKDRDETREAFVSKCETYLRQGVGLAMVDVVTSRRADLHALLLARLGASDASAGGGLYAAAYRPVERDGEPQLDIWREALTLGQPLPTLSLWLRGGLCLPVELESTYERTCREHRLAG
jgi:hypothetical protein